MCKGGSGDKSRRGGGSQWGLAMGFVLGRKGRKQLEEELKEAAIYIYIPDQGSNPHPLR